MKDTEMIIPKGLEDQKVSVSLDQLAELSGKRSVTEKKPAVSKDDYLRLAQLRIDKLFGPKIQKAKNRLAKLEKEYNEKYVPSKVDQLLEKQAEREHAPTLQQIEEAFQAVVKANLKLDRLGKIFKASAQRGLTEVPNRKFDSMPQSDNTWGVWWKYVGFGTTVAFTIKAKDAFKKYLTDRTEKAKAVAKAKEDCETLNKCHSKAKTELTSEVEMGLLENMIEKDEEAQDLAKTINDRITKRVASHMLSP